MEMPMEGKDIKKLVKKRYNEIAEAGSASCCSCSCGKDNEQLSKSIGYSDDEVKGVPEANLGLGCGNPTALGEIKEGDVVVDLGSGAGIDCFLASRKVGSMGKVIGIDMTDEMIKKSREIASSKGYENVEFRPGEIEDLPVEDESVDVIISNCVINLSPDKEKVFRESFRVLKKGGRMYVSDMVLLEELTKEQRADEELISGCVGGALLRDEYLRIVREAGFGVRVLSEDREISKRQYAGLPVQSLRIEAIKNV